jgi:hypothetical protein
LCLEAYLSTRATPIQYNSAPSSSVRLRSASTFAAPFRIFKLARLRAIVGNDPSSAEAHRALYASLLGSNSVRDAEEVIEQFERSSGLFAAHPAGEQAAGHDLLRDDKLFDLYLSALAIAGKTAAGEKLVQAATRRDSLIAGKELPEAQETSEPSSQTPSSGIPSDGLLAKAVVDRSLKPGTVSRVAGGGTTTSGGGDGQPIRVVVEEGTGPSSDPYALRGTEDVAQLPEITFTVS